MEEILAQMKMIWQRAQNLEYEIWYTNLSGRDQKEVENDFDHLIDSSESLTGDLVRLKIKYREFMKKVDD